MANNTLIKNQTTGETYTNLFSNLSVSGNVSCNSITCPGMSVNLSGCSFANTTASLMSPIPTAVTKIPIGSGTNQFNWRRNWDLDIPNNRLIYTGTPNNVRFSVRFEINLTHAGGTTHTVFVQVLSTLSGVSGNQIKAQQITGAVNAFTFSGEAIATLNSGDGVEFNIYANTSGPNMAQTAAAFTGGIPVYAFAVCIEELSAQ